jgi:hypothetical protein
MGKQKKAKNITNTPEALAASIAFQDKDQIEEDSTRERKPRARQIPVTAPEGDNSKPYIPVDTRSEQYARGLAYGMTVLNQFEEHVLAGRNDAIVFEQRDPQFTIATLDVLFKAGVLLDQDAAAAHQTAIEVAAKRKFDR